MKNVDRATLQLFWEAGLRNRRLLFLAFAFPLSAVLLNMAAPFLVGKILAALTVSSGDPAQYIPYFIAVSLLGFLGNRYGFMALLAHQARTMSYLQAKALGALMKRSVGFHHNNVGGKLVSDAIDLPQAYSLIAGNVYANVLPFVLTLVIGTVVVFIESWKLGLVVLAMVAYALISGIFDSRRRAHLRVRRLKATKEVTGHMADTILNMFTVKTFAREPNEMDQHKSLNQTLLDYRLADWKIAARSGSNRVGGLLILQLGFILLTIQLVRDDPALLGVGIFVFSFIILLSNRLFEINTMIRNIEDGLL
ncbi:MAG TPA: ABC transporter transmembrane domain-containing protein [Candidatus Saccharimonadales bacterium]|nr:ABC transporter transmembrane domain-containing protein [Candidatus Saccharimonadales bacterium]